MDNSADLKFKQRFIKFHSGATFVRVIYLGICFYILGNEYLALIHLVGFFFTIYLAYLSLFNKLSYSVVQILNLFMRPYYIFHFLGSIFLWKYLPIHLMWVVFLPVYSLFANDKKGALKSGFYLLVTLIVPPIIAYLTGMDVYSKNFFENLTENELLFLEYSMVILIFLSFIMNIYLYLEYSSGKKEESQASHYFPPLNKSTEIKNAVYQIKFDKLYEKIIEYLEQKKPYTDPDIKITDIAKAVGTNKTYVSMALNKKGKKFNDLINYYRIEQAKKDLIEGRKSMREIYTEAGFRYSATFNNVFEEREGVKPYEF